MIKGTDSFLVLNRLWNLKVEAAQTKLVELESLCKFLGLEKIPIEGKLVPVTEIVKEWFVKLIGRTKA